MKATAPMGSAVVLAAYPDSVASFRGELIRSLVREGCEATVMTAEAEPAVRQEIESLGVTFQPYRIQRSGMDPRSDWKTLRELQTAFCELQPDLILAYTIKPIIWGGIAARRIPRCRFVALVTGLGYAFQGKSLKRRLVNHIAVRLYRFALRRASAVIFQNADNRDQFIRLRIVPAEKCHVVAGSGINVEDFVQSPLPPGPPRFLLIARLLGEKGIREYVEAAKLVRARTPGAQFELVGPPDPSPDGIPLAEVRAWDREGVIRYSGATRDVRPHIAHSHIYVLPSYHEGMPRTVLEAMAMGRPILTTDVSGCKETVRPDVNGWLVPPANAQRLAERMNWFVANPARWQAMGDASRRLAEEIFDVRKVNEHMLRIMGLPTTAIGDPS